MRLGSLLVRGIRLTSARLQERSRVTSKSNQIKMNGPKSRPSITITTYSASKTSYLRQSIEGRQDRIDAPDSGATRSDYSTNFFRSNKRIGGSQQNRTTPRTRTLTDLSQIKGPTGSVRGHKDVVRRSLEGIKVTYHNRYSQLTALSPSSSLTSASLLSLSTFFANQLAIRDTSLGGDRAASNSASSSLLKLGNELYCSEYLARLVEEEQNLCVAYTTTLGVIRRTFEDSKILKSILNLNLVKYEERDIYLNQEYKFQLRLRTGGSMSVPALFVDGQYIGGTLELENMNENGQLQVLLAKFKMSKAQNVVCTCCGNARFIACQSCNGSRKSTIHHFKFNSIALRCIKCDKNDGLIQCPMCCGDQSRETDLGEAKTDTVEPAAVATELDVDGLKEKETQVDINNN